MKKEERGEREQEREEKPELVVVEPLHPAWDDLIVLSDSGKRYRVQIAALHTALQVVSRSTQGAAPACFHLTSVPPYEPSNAQPFIGDDDFELRSQCMVHLEKDGPIDNMETEEAETNNTDSICLFLYEVSRHFPKVVERNRH